VGVNAVSWAPAAHMGSRPAAGDAAGATKRIATGGCDHLVRIYASVPLSGQAAAAAAQARGPLASPEGWQLEATLPGHKDWVRDVAWAPSAGGLAPNMLASCSDDGTVLIWRQATPGGEWTSEALPHFPAPVWRVSWSVSGNLLAVSCGDNSVTLWRESLGGPFQHISTVPDATPAGY
jgi:protein transport protein SEC13